nr:MAG TPA: hypothetical protein [Caudoviricetes sp.]
MEKVVSTPVEAIWSPAETLEESCENTALESLE